MDKVPAQAKASESIATRTARLLYLSRTTILKASGDRRLDMRLSLRRILLSLDPEANYVDGLLDPTVGDSIVMLYTDGSRLRVANDLIPHVVPT